MNLLSERLLWAMSKKAERDHAPVIPAQVAREAKVSNATLNYWLNNTNGISAAKARMVGAFLRVDPLWLETGEGDPEPKKVALHVVESSPKDTRMILAFEDEERLLDLFRRCDLRGKQEIIDTALRESGGKPG